MSREVRVNTKEVGPLDLLVIYRRDGVLEPAWVGLDAAPEFLRLIPSVSFDDFESVLRGFSWLLVSALKLDPDLTRRRLMLTHANCDRKKTCKLYARADCTIGSKKIPWCFEPIVPAPAVDACKNAIQTWVSGRYIVIVTRTT